MIGAILPAVLPLVKDVVGSFLPEDPKKRAEAERKIEAQLTEHLAKIDRLTLAEYATGVDADTSTFVLLADSSMTAARGRKPAALQLQGGGSTLLQLELTPANTGGEQ